ncbi:TetR/AcrR family transcriptional regulator [Halopseudomonas xiamenensis]|uniref:TetR/AcrR family transcriptional regulator n=1 Tax=Halopseudomonas xiamenensis TaxID=157792 RepID=UPI001624618C|nr:TetR/AcrR family transcriptional regulator [Halopseudomonas xiamenensis]
MDKKSAATRRLSPEARKAQILKTARRILSQSGLNGFSLEAVAREAGVAATLPRYYFGSTDDLLRAATQDIMGEVEKVLLGNGSKEPMRNRFSSYLQIMKDAPWGHEVWMRASELHADLDSLVQSSRRHMVESMYGRPWSELDLLERLDGRGRIGYIEAVVSQWIEQGMGDVELVADILTGAAHLLDKRRDQTAGPADR